MDLCAVGPALFPDLPPSWHTDQVTCVHISGESPGRAAIGTRGWRVGGGVP